ncbi:TIGR02996 domain-containing protein [Gemmata sp. JC717]|uniref:TIGR02996 domain-containing protein n=1 Tax=Gemmata algarum TaxID=2975278 RepID=UPI0021BBB3B3|nr:TIGR02996 domain-containing protein [Gemmata algarum]MDY3555633.1 TIGR02996 domain-containing protein [Gemmata algarum]
MNPDNPLLQALIADPGDDTLRLAMADWFDENDDPARAEFVRVQVELAHGVPDRARRRELELRQRDLLVAHDREWVAPLARVLNCERGQWGGWVFRRGFVEYFNLPAPKVNEHGDRLARLTPVRELFLRPCSSGSVFALCRNRPWVRSVTHLYLDVRGLTDTAAIALAECPSFAGVRVLWYAEGGMSDRVRERFHQRFPFATSGGF